MNPPFKITNSILSLVSKISSLQGNIEATGLVIPEPQLRKKNQIKTIKGTLSIEGNTLTEDQITALLAGKKVLGHENQILEVLNTNELYQAIDKFKYASIKDLLKAHKILMKNILKDAGSLRNKNVGIFKGKEVGHIAPKPFLVPELIEKLFIWAQTDKDVHFLIKSCILHYELEFIHPFADGNGRIGRFWQTLTLSKFDPIFKFIPIESLIKERQKSYYESLEISDKEGESTVFIEFMLGIILKSLEDFSSQIVSVPNTPETRMSSARKHFKKKAFNRKDYMVLHKDISSATASRDLLEGIKTNNLSKKGEGNQSKYLFNRL